MPRFLTGDELGSIKSILYDPDVSSESKTLLKTLHNGAGRTQGVQRLAISRDDTSLLASAHADGSLCLSSFATEDKLEQLQDWKETRWNAEQRFVGLASTQNAVYSCASNGALRMTSIGEDARPTHTLSALPSRLLDWRLSPNRETFAYGGEEVEVSIWNTERAFAPRPESPAASSSGKKRKRADVLFPGEIWRAKNVPDDHLGLRQPVHNTCLTYPTISTQQILAGTRFGDLRHYDTRSGRRPVSDYKGLGKVGGIRSVEKGLLEHEVFVSDQGTNLFALDLRNGKIMYGYRGISGAVNSLAAAPSIIVSVSLDRYARVHSTCPPPNYVGMQQENKGRVLDKVYMTTIPTVVVWDQSDVESTRGAADRDGGDVWDQMKHVGESDQE